MSIQAFCIGFLALSFDEALSGIGDLSRRPPSFDAYQNYIRGWVRAFSGYWPVLAQSLHFPGEHEQELEAARRGFAQHPDRRVTMLQRQAVALIALGRIEEFHVIVGRIETDHDPRRVDSVLVVPAEILITGGRMEAGRRVAERAIEWFEGRPSQEAASSTHREHYGRTLFLVDRKDEARAVFGKLVDDDPNAMSARAFRAFIAADGGDDAQASFFFPRSEDLS